MDQFLEADSFDERRHLILSDIADSRLEQTSLARPLPPAVSIQVAFSEIQPITDAVDTYFLVQFDTDSPKQGSYSIMVRTQNNIGPRVAVEAFLDAYDDRLKQFASKATDQSEVFAVLVAPLASCRNQQVPKHAEKGTLQLMNQAFGDVIADAYFRKSSSIQKLLEDGSYRLSYGNPVPAKVLLRWNFEESPAHPYLEVVKIKGFGWGP